MKKRIEIIDFSLHSDERGWAAVPFPVNDFPEKTPANIHLVSLNPGKIRGNHYHEESAEYLFCTQGILELTVADADGSNKEIMLFNNEMPFLIKIPLNVAHAVKNIGDCPVFLLCYSHSDQKAQKMDQKAIKLI